MAQEQLFLDFVGEGGLSTVTGARLPESSTVQIDFSCSCAAYRTSIRTTSRKVFRETSDRDMRRSVLRSDQ